MNSQLFHLNTRDFIRGLIVAIIGTILSGVYTLIQNGANFTWTEIRTVLLAGLLAAISYLLKNLATNSEGKFLASESMGQGLGVRS